MKKYLKCTYKTVTPSHKMKWIKFNMFLETHHESVTDVIISQLVGDCVVTRTSRCYFASSKSTKKHVTKL